MNFRRLRYIHFTINNLNYWKYLECKMQVIGKGTWLDKVAKKLIEREKKIGRDVNLIKVESGLGASGIPHIGSLGDAVRAYGIKMALENMGSC